MSYNPGVPVSAQSPSIFPSQGQVNFTRLQAIIQKDHQFNLSTAGNDGYHKIIHLQPQSTPGAVVGTGQLYGRTIANVYPVYKYPNSAGPLVNPEMIIPTFGAAGTFQGTAIVGACTPVGVVFNCTASRTAQGRYTVSFTSALSNSNYIYNLSVEMPTTSFSPTVYVVTRSSSNMTIEFRSSLGFYDPITFSLMIMHLPPAA